MSDTQETDEVAELDGSWEAKAIRMTDFAHKLERERDEARHIAKEAHLSQWPCSKPLPLEQ